MRPFARTLFMSSVAFVRDCGRFRFESFRCFVQCFEIGAVAPHQIEHASCRVGIGVGGNSGLIENRVGFRDFAAAHPTGDHRLAWKLGIMRQLLGNGRCIGQTSGSQDHQQAVGGGILDGDIDRLGITLRIGVSDDVDGILMAPVARQESASVARWWSEKARPADRRRTSNASVARTAGPPAFVTIVRLGPFGRGCLSRASER